MKSVIACLIVLLPSLSVLAGPRVDIVIGEKAPALERLAADELASQLKRVYEADVKIAATAPVDAPHVIFVGSPDTNASMKPFAAQWPSGDKKLTDQGHLLRSVTHRDRPALLIGGGSPVATYWAVAEFGHHIGIRSLLFGDLDPIAPSPFRLKEYDIVIEPSLRERGWSFATGHPENSGSWSAIEFRSVLRQLAKLKFNRVVIPVRVEEPFVEFEYPGIPRTTSVVWDGKTFPVAGDTAGRKAFGGAKLFEHPSFAGTKTVQEQLAAGKKHLSEVVSAAREHGLGVTLKFPVNEFPKEYGKQLDSSKFQSIRRTHTVLVRLDALSNTAARDLVRTQWRAYLRTYPEIDTVDLDWLVGERSDLLQLLGEPGMLRTIIHQTVAVRSLEPRDRRMASVLFSKADKPPAPKSEIALVSQHQMQSVLPTIRLAGLQQEFPEVRSRQNHGFIVTSWGLSDLDLTAYWLSRMTSDRILSRVEVCQSLLDPVCGDGVAQRFEQAMGLIQEASDLLDSSDKDFGITDHEAVTSLFASDEPVPQWWHQVRDKYLNAMNEMYRANTRAREGGRQLTLYWARRCEFGYEYMNFSEAVRNANIAEKNKDSVKQLAELEKAIESLNNGLNAMAAVARSNSDRGLIAVLNEHGYRPLKKKLAEAEAAK